MSETYRDTETMAWPGQEEFDYNIRVPIWEQLGLTVGEPPAESTDEHALQSPDAEKINPIDWKSFDFASMETDSKEVVEPVVSSPLPVDEDVDVDNFFKNLELAKISAAAAAVSSSSSNDDDDSVDLFEEGEIELYPGKKIPDPVDESLNENFVIPPEWLQKEHFRDHVGYEVWSTYLNDSTFNRDEQVWNDDVFHNQSFEHVLGVVNKYLVDHQKISAEIDNAKYITKMMDIKFREYYAERLPPDESREPFNPEEYLKDPIPKYLTPDIDRGINYSMEVLEMKGRMTLAPFRLDPNVEYADDTFTYNEDQVTLNQVGTIRDQYNWTPSPLNVQANWTIESEVVEKIQPILRFLNHLADLKSTKVGIPSCRLCR